ncbi:ABC transporter ATP-binding protein [Flavitalea sp. BT771]|uniref:ABC transporter ATP-binding protein n=1 Tax=Flavitalea sp. BT771 TaxID=3063329 RepID=UPI0026E482BE|nr:ABC transporter ATP-binding protein [Flavitalea sp. BT771]MDO6431388.1 ABC transporter ATP-binding protein [Flavitalea sp. BT771]MDV6220296.1 ABC transporter ATP-binding protein [Flavitalea sp. BT771]
MKDNRSVSRLQLEKVSHSFGQVSVLHDLSLVVNHGEVVVLVGPSGCGKSTILNVLSGHIIPLSGLVRSEGVVRTIHQQDGLFPWLTVSENIAMGLRSMKDTAHRTKEVSELINLVHLEGFEHHYPHQLSGGMRQRVELARVLAGDSDILLMDEPFSALDYQSRLRMRRELIRLLQLRLRTVVFVTHDIEEAAQLADRVLVLSGRPATISCELLIDAPRPRDLTDNAVIEAMKKILKELGL